MLDLIQILGPDERKFAFTLFLAGSALIVVNLITHSLVEALKKRRVRREQVDRNLKPLLRATADFISRLSEILITNDRAMVEAVQRYQAGAGTLETHVESLTAATLDRHESTAYRLINFLTLSNAFTRQTADLSSFPLLDRVEYFLTHKIAVSFRGNLYNRPWLSTEIQEDLAATYLDCDRERKAAELSVSNFIAYLKSGKYPLDLYSRALEFVGLVSPTCGGDEQIDRSSKEWKHALMLAHLGIYLIDFYQELANDPQWEEQRVFFVKLVRQWNADGTKHRYLYEPGDLEGDDYFRTFPSKRTSSQSALHLVPSLFGVREYFTAVTKRLRLNIRGSRFGRRHHPKEITKWGVRIRVGERLFDVNWTNDLRTVHASLTSYLGVRRLGT